MLREALVYFCYKWHAIYKCRRYSACTIRVKSSDASGFVRPCHPLTKGSALEGFVGLCHSLTKDRSCRLCHSLAKTDLAGCATP